MLPSPIPPSSPYSLFQSLSSFGSLLRVRVLSFLDFTCSVLFPLVFFSSLRHGLVLSFFRFFFLILLIFLLDDYARDCHLLFFFFDFNFISSQSPVCLLPLYLSLPFSIALASLPTPITLTQRSLCYYHRSIDGFPYLTLLQQPPNEYQCHLVGGFSREQKDRVRIAFQYEETQAETPDERGCYI